MKFDEQYTKYWENTINKSIDGTVIAGVNEVRQYMNYLEFTKVKILLDLGCSFGRMYEPLSKYSDAIYGVEPDPYAAERARLQPYSDVRQGAAEQTGFAEEFFDGVFCWAVFDVVDQKKGLTEMNRILKVGGKLLLTGKNNNYLPDDVLAFKAEKNANLKNFPNRFTDLAVLLTNFTKFGFQLDKLLIFRQRGDFGLVHFEDYGNKILDNYAGYEYLIIGHKIGKHDANAIESLNIENKFSKTAETMAKKHGCGGSSEYFKAIGID